MELPPTAVPAIISGASGILGALVGGLTTGLATWINRECARRRALSERRRALASAIAAETEAYLELMARRQHTEHAEARLKRLQDGENISLRGWLPAHEIDWDYFPFFHASISEIGIL